MSERPPIKKEGIPTSGFSKGGRKDKIQQEMARRREAVGQEAGYYKQLSVQEVSELEELLVSMTPEERQETLGVLKSQLSEEDYERLSQKEEEAVSPDVKIKTAEPTMIKEEKISAEMRILEEASNHEPRLALPEKRFPTGVEGKIGRAAKLILKAPTPEDADKLFGIFSKLNLITGEEYEELKKIKEVPPQEQEMIRRRKIFGMEGQEEGIEESAGIVVENEAAPKSILDNLPLDELSEEVTNLKEAAARRALKNFAQELLQKKLKVFEDVNRAGDLLDEAITDKLTNGELSFQDPLVKDLLEDEPDKRKALGVFIEEIKKQQVALTQLISHSPTPRQDFEEKTQAGGELDYFSPEEKQKILAEMEKETTEMEMERLLENPPEGEISRWLEERRRKIQEERERIRGAVGYARKQRRKIAAKGRWRGSEELRGKVKTKAVVPQVGEFLTAPAGEEFVDEVEEELKNRQFIESLRKDPKKFAELERDYPASTIERLKEEIRLLEWEELVGGVIEKVRKLQKEKIKKIKEFWTGETEKGEAIPDLVGLKDYLKEVGSRPAIGFHLKIEEAVKLESALRMLQDLELGHEEIEDWVKLQKEGPPEGKKKRAEELRQPLRVAIGMEDMWKKIFSEPIERRRETVDGLTKELQIAKIEGVLKSILEVGDLQKMGTEEITDESVAEKRIKLAGAVQRLQNLKRLAGKGFLDKESFKKALKVEMTLIQMALGIWQEPEKIKAERKLTNPQKYLLEHGGKKKKTREQKGKKEKKKG